MARRAKAAEAARSNGYDPEKLQGYVKKIEGLLDDKASEHGAYMQRCQTINQSIGVVYEEAKALGIPKKALKAVVKIRELDEKKRQAIEALNEDDGETFVAIHDALGDDFCQLPLGMAAVEREQDADAQSALNSLNG